MNQETINRIYNCVDFIHKAEKTGANCDAQREYVDNILSSNRTNLDVLDIQKETDDSNDWSPLG